ncbi:RidA family protein [Chthonomonas calidirosea]|uniref:Endoribonuclease L-PSP n=1 Tax=Chthonomonas calidirosea (strain DSM 23976 / ICMP 18418 / T49) TaxID=1303518 RepID=S0ESH7_CHTCT|nr:Rid family detoxifying hydrolase [Chthonomonas calidirosea]CCW34246.1 endoribonuclease L-PSP [Chthonomonas calidirosea T49]CEK14161.1 endoribonuclease L-PSP [Chthonomonas calidirosea]CEK15332.1 endoribonuclease L-PSP [Chthonomonas calidirosea]
MEKIPVYTGAIQLTAPYTPGIRVGNLVFVSGQIPLDPSTQQIVRDDFERAVRQCIENVQRVLSHAGTGLEHCVKVTVFLKDMNNFERLNKVYVEYFGLVKPARTCIQAAGLPLDVDVEIEAIAVVPD